MIIQEHPAWGFLPSGLLETDAMLTEYLNGFPPLDPALFDEYETKVLQAQAAGDNLHEMRSIMSESELRHAYNGVREKVCVDVAQSVVYRACASGIVKYEIETDAEPQQLNSVASIIFKARMADYPEWQILELMPDVKPTIFRNYRRHVSACLHAHNVIYATTQAFRFGLLAPDVVIKTE